MTKLERLYTYQRQSPWLDNLTRPYLRDGTLAAFWMKDGTVLAGMNVNTRDVTGAIEALVRSGAQPDPSKLANPDVPLTDLTG